MPTDNLFARGCMYRTLDTLEIVKSLVSSGMSVEAAEAVAKAIAISRETDISNLASKADLMKVDNKMENKLGKLQTELLKVENRLESKITDLNNKFEIKFAETDAKICSMRVALYGEIEKCKNEMIKWSIGTAIASTGTMSGFTALLFKYFIQ